MKEEQGAVEDEAGVGGGGMSETELEGGEERGRKIVPAEPKR